MMTVVYAGQFRTTLKECVRRTDGAVTRTEVIESGKLVLGIDKLRIVKQLDSLGRRGQIYNVGDAPTRRYVSRDVGRRR
jgi:hypothetical protein